MPISTQRLRTVLKAHGVTPTWSARLKFKGLSAKAKAAFRRINLRWHDLRHEYASRLVERGVPLAQVRDLLGHASITTTERYDTQKLENLQVAVTKLERGIEFDAITPGVGSLLADAQRESAAQKKRSRAVRSVHSTAKIARTKFQESFKYEGVTPRSRGVKEVPALEPNELEDLNSENWLGGRESLPLFSETPKNTGPFRPSLAIPRI